MRYPKLSKPNKVVDLRVFKKYNHIHNCVQESTNHCGKKPHNHPKYIARISTSIAKFFRMLPNDTVDSVDLRNVVIRLEKRLKMNAFK